jgi:hypothetical protein
LRGSLTARLFHPVPNIASLARALLASAEAHEK